MSQPARDITPRPPTRSQVNFHYGKAMMKLANTYVSLLEAVLEAVQNSIDSDATKVGVFIDRRERSISIVDNGHGVSRSGFENALNHICDSEKKVDQMGRFGLGLITSLGKCEWFSFTSCPENSREGYLEWTFNSATIAKQAVAVEIPVISRPLYYKPPEGGKVQKGLRAVQWRTRLHIHNYVTDRKISDIRSADALKEAILEKYGVAMQRKNVSVTVKITDEHGREEIASGKAKRFSGKKLPEVIIDDEDAGKSIFRLYLAKKGNFGYQGKVLVGIVNDDFRSSMVQFLREASDLLPEEVVKLFKTGIFEGEILTTNGKLHDSRKKLESNDAYVGFCTAIEQWFTDHGKKHLAETQDARQEERIQDLSVRSLQNLQSMLSNAAFERLRKETIDSFAYGTKKAANASNTALAAVLTAGSEQEPVEKDQKPAKGSSGSDRKGTPSYTVAGPQGRQQQQAKDAPRGLQFEHLPMRPEGPLSVLEPKDGTIFFNVEHPEWVAAAAAGDRELMQLQEFGAILALVQHTMPDEYASVVELVYGDLLLPLAYLMRNSPSFNLNARIKASKKKEV